MIGKLVGVIVNTDGVYNLYEFEVIKTMDNNQLYQKFTIMEWAFDNQEIINLKKREMIFEGGIKLTTPLDPT
jgi:hypothetical protein